MTTKLQQLVEQGQSPWIDNITRGMIVSGELQSLVDKGVRGLTANPTIFEKAITSSTDYDDEIRRLVTAGSSASEIYEQLILADIRDAADILRPIYDETNGLDGYVSLEVSPSLAFDTEGTIKEARKFFREVDRPNLFIKVPATDEGIPAIRQLLSEGINVNITLIFAIEYYEQVMDAYLDALESLHANGKPLDRTASVASFFVSRVDTEIDKRLDKLTEAETDEGRRSELRSLKGRAAIANAKIAYERFTEKFSSPRFEALKAAGAHVQRPLWASTSTKNPEYRDVMYVEELIGPNTVNTMPPATIDAFLDHGRVERTIDRDVEEAHRVMSALDSFGIRIVDVTDKLQADGVKSFADSFSSLDRNIEEKRTKLLEESQGRTPVHAK